MGMMDEIMTPGITRVAGIRGGRPCIEGAGIRVTDIVMAAQFGEFARSEIVAELEILPEQVDAAFTYFEHNKAYIDNDIQRQFDSVDKLAKAGYGRPKTPVLSL